MDKEEHRKRHKELHVRMDELLGDFISHTGKLPSETSVMELIEWSYKQTLNPQEMKYE